MPAQPNVAQGLLYIHACITRALDVSIEHGDAFARQGFASAALRIGYGDYVRCLVSTLDAHHLGEEEIAFPYFAKLLPDAPYEDLLADHRRIVIMLEQIKPQIEKAASAANPGQALDQLVTLLQQVRQLWHAHIPKEEASFTVERLAGLIPLPEHIRLLREFGEFAQKHSGPDYLTVPFTLHNLEPEERAAFAAAMPPIITQQLVPIVWKDKWAPMQPFLLP